jgi:hypothetical protein
VLPESVLDEKKTFSSVKLAALGKRGDTQNQRNGSVFCATNHSVTKAKQRCKREDHATGAPSSADNPPDLPPTRADEQAQQAGHVITMTQSVVFS